jgi:hypothetical protein
MVEIELVSPHGTAPELNYSIRVSMMVQGQRIFDTWK